MFIIIKIVLIISHPVSCRSKSCFILAFIINHIVSYLFTVHTLAFLLKTINLDKDDRNGKVTNIYVDVKVIKVNNLIITCLSSSFHTLAFLMKIIKVEWQISPLASVNSQSSRTFKGYNQNDKSLKISFPL